jgi:ornithine cyclodeaminase
MKVLSVDDFSKLITTHSMEAFMRDLLDALKRDYARWDEFDKIPRPGMKAPDGIMELMPICDSTYYTYKYVNCHPMNPLQGKQTVVATGQLATVDTGYPLMTSEMTIMTAIRTAANSALAADLMARQDSKVLGMIGTGAQSEFQVHALRLVRDITTVKYYDTDPEAMQKFATNMADAGLELIACDSAEEAVRGSDIITVCTARYEHLDILKDAWVKPGMHINAIGGDSPGKTELELSILSRARVVVEYFDQAIHEGEIQRLGEESARELVYAELTELVNGTKTGRDSDEDITLFDSVGIGLEDYSVLRLSYELATKYGIGSEIELIPPIADPKNLYGALL